MTLLEGSTAKTTSTITKLSFHEFKKLKEDQRTKKIEANKKVKAIGDVKIQIRVMEELDGHLKRIKGRTLPLVVPSNVSAEALLKAAQDKHSRHFKQFDQHLDYVLLYPDQTIVHTLPGSSVLFPLNKYKEELEKPFSKLCFWLCSTSDIQSCIDFLEEESEQSSEPGPSYISDTATTASEVKERDGSLRASNCQIKTSPSTNRAVRLPTPQEETAIIQLALRDFPWKKLKHMHTSVLTSGLTLLES